MASIFSRLDNFFKNTLWEVKPDASDQFKKLSIVTLRLLYKLGAEFLNGEIPRRASSLVYTTLLTIVPILAVSFSVLKALGVHNMLEPLMRNFLAPLGEKGDEITLNVINYVGRVNVGLLGAIGLASLVYIVMNTIQQVENAFNYLWQIREKRSIPGRFRDYMSVLLIGPVLVVSALGITTSAMSNSIAQQIKSIEPFGSVLFLIGKIVPYFLMSIAFTSIYYLLPYTKVRLKSALAGGVAAGILWEAGSWTFAHFVVSSTQYSAIYSGFAIVLLFMIWLYYNWIIMLTGAKVSFYHQFPVLASLRDDRTVCRDWYRRRLSLTLMYLIGYNYHFNKPLWTLSSLIYFLRIPKDILQDILDAFERRGLIRSVNPDKSYLPARDIGSITIREVIH
ncbi:MAG TPA: YihY/virulence factor BrkB family protein, partial [Thermodesulfovibrionales bacterium]|nr:YihY/virulence factor BrkB family protein [Thermodesulfovibrionales bacterium]